MERTKHAMQKSKASDEKEMIGNKTSVLGSVENVTLSQHNVGFLSTVLEAYNQHYNLRTSPEDWWYTIVQTIAIAIDNNSRNEEVKEFLAKDSKRGLQVEIDLNGEDYYWLFEQISNEITGQISNSDYVDRSDQDFSTSTEVHKIVSKITLMRSAVDVSDNTMKLECGIPAVEMKGTEEDWELLGAKIRDYREILQPISSKKLQIKDFLENSKC